MSKRFVDITREEWILCEWEKERILGQQELVYLCVGEASIKGAYERGRDWDEMHKTFSDTEYIVSSGSGYFKDFIHSHHELAEFTTDPVSAMRMPLGPANFVITKLAELGFRAELVSIRKGHINGR